MEQVKIIIQSVNDAKEGKGTIPEMTLANSQLVSDITFIIIENGTANGQTVLMMALRDEKGNFTVGQITENHLHGIVAAVKGANERFYEEHITKG